jgi:hypothetical protein
MSRLEDLSKPGVLDDKRRISAILARAPLRPICAHAKVATGRALQQKRANKHPKFGVGRADRECL